MTELRTDLIAESVAAGITNDVVALFHANFSPAPFILWSPARADLRHPVMIRFFDRCFALPATEGGIDWQDFSLDWFAGLEPWLMLLRRDGDDFRYLHYGSTIADYYGRDMTGRATSDFPGHIGRFFDCLYHAIMERKQWLFSEHEPPRQVFVRRWQRLIVPLVERSEVTGFVAVNMPDNDLRAGLDLITDPVLVLDDDLMVCYANRSACEHFCTTGTDCVGTTIFDATGINLRPPANPMDLAMSRAVHDAVEVTFRNAIAAHLQTTLSATFLRNRAFYVLQIRVVHDPLPEAR